MRKGRPQNTTNFTTCDAQLHWTKYSFDWLTNHNRKIRRSLLITVTLKPPQLKSGRSSPSHLGQRDYTGACRGQGAAWRQDQGQRTCGEDREWKTARIVSGISCVTQMWSDKLSRAQKANSSQHSSEADTSVYSKAERKETNRLTHPDRDASPVRGWKALWPAHKEYNYNSDGQMLSTDTWGGRKKQELSC